MLKRIFIILTLAFLLLNSVPVYSQEASNKSIDNYINKVTNKFTRTYCNSTKFGISDEGALAFAVGETNRFF